MNGAERRRKELTGTGCVALAQARCISLFFCRMSAPAVGPSLCVIAFNGGKVQFSPKISPVLDRCGREIRQPKPKKTEKSEKKTRDLSPTHPNPNGRMQTG